MQKITFRYLLIFACVCIAGCATIFGDSNDIVTINSADPQAKLLIDGNEVGTGSAQYIMQRGDSAIITASKRGCADRSVRTQKKIVGAALHPVGSISVNNIPQTDKKILIYCQKGARGSNACQKLMTENEELEVYNIDGGIEAWHQAGLATESS